MRLLKLSFLISSILFLVSSSTIAQEQLGLKLENYSGINSVLLNPTNQLTSPLKWNVNIVSAGMFFENNYAYLQDASLFSALRRREDIKPRPDIDLENENPNDFLILDFYNTTVRKEASALATLMGPSVMVNLESGWSFGLFTNHRTAISTRKVPSSLNYYNFDNREELENFSVAPFKAAGMSWGELGFNVAKRIETASGTIGIGINAKYLNGNEGFYFNNKSSFDMSKFQADTLNFQSIDLAYGFTNSIAEGENYKLQRNGSGLGVDIGFTYIDGYSDGDYNWKIGASILDLGRVRFKQNAEKHSINTTDVFQLVTNDFNNLSTITDQSELFSLQSLNDSIASLDGNTFDVALPTTLTAYGDYHLTKHLYLNALLVQSIPVGENAVVRDNLLALTPRYERKWFGAMMPISLHNYKNVNIGLSARFAFLTIGTDNLASMFKQSEFTGSDFYVGLKFNPFDLGGKGGNGLFGKNKGKGCYF